MDLIGCLVVFSCRAAIDTIDALALASRTTLVVDAVVCQRPLVVVLVRPVTLSSLKQTPSSSLVPSSYLLSYRVLAIHLRSLLLVDLSTSC
jgi:hypothetical protein